MMKKYFLLIFCIIFFSEGCKKTPDNAGISITSIFPTSGVKETAVTIIGTGFDKDFANNTVFFNGKEAKVVGGTATSLEVFSPIGAGTGAVEVITKNGQKATGSTFYHRWTAKTSTLKTNGDVFDNSINDLAIDAAGNLYTIAQTFVYKVTPEGQVSKISNNLLGKNIFGIAINSKNEIFITTYQHNVLYQLVNNTLTAVVGMLDTPGNTDGQGDAATFQDLYGLDIDANDNLYVLDYDPDFVITKIRKISPTFDVKTVTNNLISFGSTVDINTNQTGDTLWTASGDQVIRIVGSKKELLAGTINKGDKDGAALEAQFSDIWGVYKLRGEVFISDYGNQKLRYLSADGQVFTLLANTDVRNIVENKDGILFMISNDKIIKIELE